MPIQDDQTARVMPGGSVTEAEAGAMAEEMRSVLNLIAAQLEHVDHRQTQVISDLHQRLIEMGKEARLNRAKVPAAFAPAFERIQDGIEQLASLVVAEDHNPAKEVPAQVSLPESSEPEAQSTFPSGCLEAEPALPNQETEHDEGLEEQQQPAADFLSGDSPDHEIADFDEAASDASFTMQPVSMVFPSFEPAAASEHSDSESDAEDHLITDNAVDRMDFVHDDHEDVFASLASSRDQIEEIFDRSDDANGSSEQAAEPAPEPEPEPSSEPAPRFEPPVFAIGSSEADEPWDLEQAEALTRIYESEEAGFGLPAGESQDMVVAAPSVSEAARAEPPAEQREWPAPAFDTEPREPFFKSSSDIEADLSHGAPAVDRAWLEQRFRQMTATIQDSFSGLRDDEPVAALSDRFGQLEERVRIALEDLASHHDGGALRNAEAQIDSMVGCFERVEAQLSRIDTLESQVGTLLDRLSEEWLAEHASLSGGAAQTDSSDLAEAAAENVAQRFLVEFRNGTEGDNAAIAEMREALEAFMRERREREEEGAGMLDTIQQALISVLDRVELLETGSANPPMTSPIEDDFDDAGLPPPAEDELLEHSQVDLVLPDDEEPLAETDTAPEASSAVQERFREQRDYSQYRLEYPAAIMGNRPTEEPPHEEAEIAGASMEIADIQPEEPHEFDAASEPGTGIADPGGQEPDAPQSAPVEVEQHADPDGDGGELPQVSAIDRLRQEFIADARRARERAAEEALKEEAASAEKASAPSRVALPGLSSVGAKLRSAASLRGKENAAEVADLPGSAHALSEDKQAAESGRFRFSLSRSRMLVGAVIVLFATAGALLMMRGKSQPAVDVSTPVIEHQFERGMPGPELIGPEESAPGLKNGLPEEGRQGSLDGDRIYDGEFNYDVPAETEERPIASALAGVALADLEKAPDVRKLAAVRRRQELARMSSDLGAAAAYATPAHLLPEHPAARQALPGDNSLARSGGGSHLDLPPATVGPLSLRLAAAKGDPSAQFEVAARLAGGTGTKQDLKGAVRWYQLSAAQGFAQAQYRLGTLYERGLGVDKDLARAGIWYERAAGKGNIKAMHNLAVVSAGREAGGPDYRSAAKWFEEAAAYGLSDSQFNLAVLFENGLGVDKDLKRAFINYALAAAKGDAQAKTRRDEVRALLSPTNLAAAERDVEKFRPKIAPRLVNDPRVAGEDWKRRADHSYNN